MAEAVFGGVTRTRAKQVCRPLCHLFPATSLLSGDRGLSKSIIVTPQLESIKVSEFSLPEFIYFARENYN